MVFNLGCLSYELCVTSPLLEYFIMERAMCTLESAVPSISNSISSPTLTCYVWIVLWSNSYSKVLHFSTITSIFGSLNMLVSILLCRVAFSPS